MKSVFSILFFWLCCFAYSQEQAVFYFDNNKFELNKTEAAKLQKWIAENSTSKILSITGSKLYSLKRLLISSFMRIYESI